MDIYTTYFGKLRRLPSSIIPIAVCLYAPSWWEGLRYPLLAPLPGIFSEYKRTNDFERYTELYRRQLSVLSASEVVETLKLHGGGKDVALVCYEEDPATCHRSCIAEWLNDNGVPCREWVG